ncbi:hypothetical protein Y1Q_0022542 [Alligator mississippiensis]|uniref:Uncharacterized protein n=1 Tax=Alligator mississippiensis TaxID=8496 RepID=A0A151NW91_ALLMI|nr:hypothetical protein Y1Q_0022542 [Alligator mississippiensis]
MGKSKTPEKETQIQLLGCPTAWSLKPLMEVLDRCEMQLTETTRVSSPATSLTAASSPTTPATHAPVSDSSSDDSRRDGGMSHASSEQQKERSGTSTSTQGG